MSGSPNGFPNQKNITVGKFSLEIQQKPSKKINRFLEIKNFVSIQNLSVPVAKVEMTEVTIFLYGII